MDRNSNKYTFIYAIIMVVVVATILTVIAVVLQPAQKRNVELEKKKNILAAIKIKYDDSSVEALYDKHIIENYAINVKGEKLDGVDAFKVALKDELRKPAESQQWPVYVAKLDDESVKYVFPLFGKGLWGPIWGFIAFNDDLNTVFGISLDHKSETPGLGAEINTEEFESQFVGKRIFNDKSEFVSINVIKIDASDNPHAVDAISGGTITCNGLRDMLAECVGAYMVFIDEHKK